MRRTLKRLRELDRELGKVKAMVEEGLSRGRELLEKESRTDGLPAHSPDRGRKPRRKRPTG